MSRTETEDHPLQTPRPSPAAQHGASLLRDLGAVKRKQIDNFSRANSRNSSKAKETGKKADKDREKKNCRKVRVLLLVPYERLSSASFVANDVPSELHEYRTVRLVDGPTPTDPTQVDFTKVPAPRSKDLILRSIAFSLITQLKT